MTFKCLTHAGKFLADLVPRCTDPSLAVRQDALGAVQVLLRIQEIYQGNFEPDVMVEAISKLQERTEKQDSKEQFAVVNDLAKVFAKKVAKEELLQFLYPLLEGLLDKEADRYESCLLRWKLNMAQCKWCLCGRQRNFPSSWRGARRGN